MKNKIHWSYPLIYQKGRLSIWQKAFGMLKNNKIDHTKELKKIRLEWDRKDFLKITNFEVKLI